MNSSRETGNDGSGGIGTSSYVSLVDRLEQNDSSLTELAGFGHCTLDQISNALIKNTTVSSFKLNSCNLGDEACTTIMQALALRCAYQANKFCLRCRPRTKRISFARNRIGVDGARQIAKFLHSSTTKCHGNRKHSDQSVCYRSKSVCEKCGDDKLLLPRFMEDFIRLELLSNSIGDGGAIAIADAMASVQAEKYRSHCIVELGLERNGIANVGMNSICEMLKTNTSLYILHIGRNAITWEGMVHLADALASNTTLESLSLTGNVAIGDEGVAVLSGSLKHNATLKTLLLSKCGISSKGTNHLINGLYCDLSPYEVVDSSNHALVKISLSSSSACSYLAENSLSLRTLTGWNELGPPTARRLKLGYYLCSESGIRYVHSLGLDRKIFPSLLCKLWKVFRDDIHMNKRPVNTLDVVWCYIKGMPEMTEK